MLDFWLLKPSDAVIGGRLCVMCIEGLGFHPELGGFWAIQMLDAVNPVGLTSEEV